jgi:hypothetical protein
MHYCSGLIAHYVKCQFHGAAGLNILEWLKTLWPSGCTPLSLQLFNMNGCITYMFFLNSISDSYVQLQRKLWIKYIIYFKITNTKSFFKNLLCTDVLTIIVNFQWWTAFERQWKYINKLNRYWPITDYNKNHDKQYKQCTIYLFM